MAFGVDTAGKPMPAARAAAAILAPLAAFCWGCGPLQRRTGSGDQELARSLAQAHEGARRSVALMALPRQGRWLEADSEFRRFLAENGGAGEDELAMIVGAWKGPSVAAPTFIRGLASGKLGPGPSRRFGEELLRQGFASLAAVELERAEILGDVSEELYAGLLECYRRAGDDAGLRRTLAVARGRHPGAARFQEATQSTAPVSAPGPDAALKYPEWVAWSLPTQDSGALGRNAIWSGDAVVYAVAAGGGSSRVWSWSPSDGEIRWSFDVEGDLPRRLRRKPEAPSWRERDPFELALSSGRILLRYREYEYRTNPEGGASGTTVALGEFALDPGRGTASTHRRRPADQDAWSPAGCGTAGRFRLPGACKDALQDASGLFVLLEDLRLLRLDLSTAEVRWVAKVDDEPQGGRLARFGDWVLVPGAGLGLTAFDIGTGSVSWRLPVPTHAPVDVSGPYIIVVSGPRAQVVGVRAPAGLERARAALVEAARLQADDALAQEILTNLIELDPSGEPAYAALAERLPKLSAPAEAEKVLAGYANFLGPRTTSYALLRDILRDRTMVRWTFRTGSERLEGIAFDDRRVYVLAAHTLSAVDRESGVLLWEVPVEGSPSGATQSLSRKLVLDHGALFLCAGSRIVAVDASTGRESWQAELSIPYATFSEALNPLAAGGTIYASVLYGSDQPPRPGYHARLLALRAADGQPVWLADVIPDVDDGYFQGGDFSLRPVLHGGTVYFPTLTGNLYAVDAATGRLLWGFAVDRFKAGYIDTSISPPVVEGGRLFVLGPTGFLYALDAGTGALLWKKDLSGTEPHDKPSPPSLAMAADRLCLKSFLGGRLLCLVPATGELAWQQKDASFAFGPPLAGGFLWSWDGDALIPRDPKTGIPRERRRVPGIRFIYWIAADGDDLYLAHSDGLSRVAPRPAP